MHIFANMFSGLQVSIITFIYIFDINIKIKNIYILLQRQLTLLKLVMIFVITFMSFILILSLLCNSCLHINKYMRIKNFINNENNKHSDMISNKSVAMFSIEEMKNIKEQLNSRKNELEQYCKTISRTSSNLDNVLSNMIIDT